MAEYLPPSEKLPTFNSAVFKETNEGFLTYDKAKKLFLTFPNAQGTETFQAINVNGFATFNNDMLLTGSKSFNVSNGSVISFNTGTYTDYLSGSYSTYKAGSLITMASAPITQSGTATNTMNTINMLSNNNITMPSGTSVITQVVTNPSDANELKKTNISINSGSGATGSVSVGLRVIDLEPLASGKGIGIAPYAQTSAYNTMVNAGDSVLFSRDNIGNSNSLTLTTYSALKTGIRIDGRTGIELVDIAVGTNLMRMQNTETLLYRPFGFGNTQYSVARTATQQGYVFSDFVAASSVISSTSIRNLGSISVAPGAWIIECSFAFSPIGGSTTVQNNTFGISSVSTSAFNATGSFTASIVSGGNFTITTAMYWQNTSRCTFFNNITSGTTPLYFNYVLAFGSVTNVSLGYNYTITRIA